MYNFPLTQRSLKWTSERYDNALLNEFMTTVLDDKIWKMDLKLEYRNISSYSAHLPDYKRTVFLGKVYVIIKICFIIIFSVGYTSTDAIGIRSVTTNGNSFYFFNS